MTSLSPLRSTLMSGSDRRAPKRLASDSSDPLARRSAGDGPASLPHVNRTPTGEPSHLAPRISHLGASQ